MASPLEISGIQQVMVKPTAWRVIEHPDDTFSLDFTYVHPERGEWAEVRTRRGEVKHYKTMNAAVADIKRVQLNSVVFMCFLGQ